MARKRWENDPLTVKTTKTEVDDEDDPFKTKREDEDDPALHEEVLDEEPPTSSPIKKIGTQAPSRAQRRSTMTKDKVSRYATQKTKKRIRRMASSDEDAEESDGFYSGLQSSSDDDSYDDESEEDQVESFREMN